MGGLVVVVIVRGSKVEVIAMLVKFDSLVACQVGDNLHLFVVSHKILGLG